MTTATLDTAGLWEQYALKAEEAFRNAPVKSRMYQNGGILASWEQAPTKSNEEASDWARAPDIQLERSSNQEAIQKLATDMVFDNSWYPSCWLVFVYLGLPSGAAEEHFVSNKVSGVTIGVKRARMIQVRRKGN